MAKTKTPKDTTPVILRPLAKHKDLVWYLLLMNDTPPHNKVYFVTVVHVEGETKVLKHWGKFGYPFQGSSCDEFDQGKVQSIVNEKAKKGYKIIEDSFIKENDDIFEAYVQYIVEAIEDLKNS